MTAPMMSRRRFLAGGGAVIAGFSISATFGGLGRAAAAALGPGSGGEVENQWIVVTAADADGTGTLVTIYTGKVELGTGVATALRQIVADELYITMDQIAYVQGDTAYNLASQGYTAGSQTVQSEGPALRQAAAAAFATLVGMAGRYFGVPASKVKAQDGTFSYRSGRATYGQVIGSSTVTATPGPNQPTKSYTDYEVVGTSVPRLDLPAKFFGTFAFSADVRLPGMVHARVIRPAGRNATFAGWGTDHGAALAVPGVVAINQTGNFVYLVAEDEATAQHVVSTMHNIAQWAPGPPFIPQATLPDALTSPDNVYASDDQVDVGDPSGSLAGADHAASAQYFTPFHMHASAAASAAVASYDGQTLTVYSGTQGPFPLQAAIAALIQQFQPGFAPAQVHVIYTEQAGCYGHDGSDDASAEAALIAYQLGRPVKLQWTRADEHQWEPLGPAMVHRLQGGISAGRVVSWQHDIYSPTHNARPAGGVSAGNLLVRQYVGGLPAPMPPLGANTATRNGPVNYSFPNMRLGRHFVKSYQLAPGTTRPSSPLTWVLPRSTALRSLGGFSNSFANESFMDEMAALAGADPLEFRLDYLDGDARAVAVLQALAHAANWKAAAVSGQGPRPVGRPPAAGHATGRGIGYIQYENALAYVATCVDVDVDLGTGVVSVTDAWVVHDCGLVINPDGLQNQIQGNIIQGISRTLVEEVDYSSDQVVQTAWQDYPAAGLHGYPVIGFDRVPGSVSVTLLDQPDQPAWGAGEPAVMTVPGAIANAVFAATGVRIRTLPMTPSRVLAALQSGSG